MSRQQESVHESRPARAQALLAELLERLESGETIDWESEWRRHSDLAPELRALHANWMRAERLLGGLSSTPELQDPAVRAALDEQALLDEAAKAGTDGSAVRSRGAVRYTELELIAQGGMGVVTRVRDHELERDLAMKTIRSPADPSATPSPKTLRRFLQEVRIAAQLQHPGILPVHDMGVDATGRPYFTMPLVRGWNLAQVIEFARSGREGWSRARLLEAILKVCDAVAYAHEQGVLHRDLKPANVLVGRFGETYVTDWGLARRVDALEPEPLEGDDDASHARAAVDAARTAHGAVLGTVNYMAPEQARGEVDALGPHSDVYALGALLYHALTGRMPFEGLDEESVLVALRRGPPAPVEQIAPDAPRELVSVCEKAMARQARDRYGSPGGMADDLRAYVERRVVSAHERGAWPELRKWFARNRRAVTWTLATALVAMVVTGVLVWSGKSQRVRNVLLADALELDALQAEAEALWPALPERTAAFERWVVRARVMIERLPAQQRELGTLRGRAGIAEGPRRFDFASPEEQWTHDMLARTVDATQRLGRSRTGENLLEKVEQGLAFAREVERQSLHEAAAEWAAAIDAIERSPRYPGVRIAPQLGLVPIGEDPSTGLWEFAHLATGKPPSRSVDGALALGPEHGIVLVLVPRSRFVLGSALPKGLGTALDPIAEAVGREPDLLARGDEGPCVELDLAPYFLAKHELTRAQRARIEWGSPRAALPSAEHGTRPVETLSWEEARALLARVDLALPSEAQWENGARAGGQTRYWCGRESGSLAGRVNAGWNADGRPLHAGEQPTTVDVEDAQANAWGFLHVAGNVGEWVEDAHRPTLTVPRRVGDGLGLSIDPAARVVRGGSFLSSPIDLRCAARRALAPDARSPEVGVRAARRVQP